ncbi:hypothetical protein P6F34_gp42 [Pseudomonas phage MiCath]|uniref:Uncharacterized protein n=1 Tax=Pseudomonas phage MiCath TaxID=3003729 RepID=A0AAF0AGU9_9CAUD|nr:hypothetical protein P6F34_gp42 [Pseudomonas phage MiCath]WAX22394.1 hypothetical protein [Pseudomonas phage MiCath]
MGYTARGAKQLHITHYSFSSPTPTILKFCSGIPYLNPALSSSFPCMLHLPYVSL